METKMKLLAVISSLEGGGAERQMAILLKGLDRTRFQSVLCLFNRHGPYLDELPDGLPIHDLQKSSKRDFPKLVCRLAALIPAVKPDVVFSKLQYTNIITATAHKLSRQRIPIVLSEETNPREALRYASYPQLRRRLLKWAYRQADAVITPSEGVASVLQADFGVSDCQLKVTPNAIELERIRTLSSEEIAPHPFFEALDPVVVTAGRLTTPKGYPYLLRAIALVNEKIPCRLLILGDGEQKEELTRLASELGISDRVAFCGFQKNPFKFMARADVFVLSSLWESFGNVLIEAMALGVPVVSTRAPYGPEEIIQDGKTGLLVPPGEAGALSEAILQILADSQFKKQLAQGGRLAAEKYDAKAIVIHYETIFAALAGSSLLRQKSISEVQAGTEQ